MRTPKQSGLRSAEDLKTCPACKVKRIHKPEELFKFHPLAGHGYTREQGPSHPDIPDYRLVGESGALAVSVGKCGKP